MRGLAPGCRPPLLAGVRRDPLPPPPVSSGLTSPGSPQLGRLGARRFAGLESSGPRVEDGRVPSTLGGAVHRRVVGGPELGRA